MYRDKKTVIVRSEENRRQFHSIRYFLDGGAERRHLNGERRILPEAGHRDTA